MLNQQESAILKKISEDDQLTAEKIHPVLESLQNRGYLKILPAKTMFGTDTGMFLFRLTEAGESLTLDDQLNKGAIHGDPKQ